MSAYDLLFEWLEATGKLYAFMNGNLETMDAILDEWVKASEEQ